MTSYTAGGQIIRQILQDPNGNTYVGPQPFELGNDVHPGLVDPNTGLIIAAQLALLRDWRVLTSPDVWAELYAPTLRIRQEP